MTATAQPRVLTSARTALFGPATRQKILAFASLIVLMTVFSLASENFLQSDNLIAILQATAVNGVLAVAATFVIITGGIDLSVGTLMTFCAVIAGVFLTYWGMPMPIGIVAVIRVSMKPGATALIVALRFAISGAIDSTMPITPAFEAA